MIAEGVEWASAKNLRDTLDIPAGDPNIIGSFHMYQPILFTHQGGQVDGPRVFRPRAWSFPARRPRR